MKYKSEGYTSFKEASRGLRSLKPELIFLGFPKNTNPLSYVWGLGIAAKLWPPPGHLRGTGACHSATLSGESASLSWNVPPRVRARVMGWGHSGPQLLRKLVLAPSRAAVQT